MAQIDVVVPSYNYSRYLEGCVASLLEQRGVDVRVLVIDDASTDDTPAVAERLAAADRRVTYRRHATNHGHIATYNEGLLEWASSDYVLLISADDLLAPGAAQRAVELLERHPEASFVCGRQVAFQDAAPTLTEADARGTGNYRNRPGLAFIAAVCEAGQNHVATPTSIIRTRAQHVVGGYERTLPHTADLEMWLRLATQGHVIEIDSVQAYKRMHAHNMQHEYLVNPEGDVRERRQAFQFFFDHTGAALPDTAAMMSRADRAIASEVFWRAAHLFAAGRVDAIENLLQFAASVDPALTSSPEWRRMALKRRLGPRVWSLVQGLAGRTERRAS